MIWGVFVSAFLILPRVPIHCHGKLGMKGGSGHWGINALLRERSIGRALLGDGGSPADGAGADRGGQHAQLLHRLEDARNHDLPHDGPEAAEVLAHTVYLMLLDILPALTSQAT